MNKTFIFRASKSIPDEIDIFGDVMEFSGTRDEWRDWCIANLDQSIVDAKGYIVLDMRTLVIKYNNSYNK